MTSLKLSVGQTVQLNDGRTAIIRFKGATTFAPGDWIGVELDEASGKNDGSVQGERYFDCEDKYGMFLRSTGIGKVVEDPGSVVKPTAHRKSLAPAATKSRPSSVSTVSSLSASNGRKRESFAASPTPARGPSGRLSSIRVRSRD